MLLLRFSFGRSAAAAVGCHHAGGWPTVPRFQLPREGELGSNSLEPTILTLRHLDFSWKHEAGQHFGSADAGSQPGRQPCSLQSNQRGSRRGSLSDQAADKAANQAASQAAYKATNEAANEAADEASILSDCHLVGGRQSRPESRQRAARDQPERSQRAAESSREQ